MPQRRITGQAQDTCGQWLHTMPPELYTSSGVAASHTAHYSKSPGEVPFGGMYQVLLCLRYNDGVTQLVAKKCWGFCRAAISSYHS